MMTRPSVLRRLFNLWPWSPLVLFVLWLGGLVAFAADIPRSVKDNSTHTDAIVVLTGGSERLDAGLSLLRQGLADKLFVSGVYHGIDVTELLRLARQKPDQVECCIVLGHAADNTLGNAAETAQWMKQEGYHSLRLVTGNYHMRRSLAEFHHAMPDAVIVAHPVFPDAVKRDRWWLWPGTAHLIISEYTKFLLGQLRQVAEAQEELP
jgi:uncharacterized SAM-binding protein YcdF (DUF218 family)